MQNTSKREVGSILQLIGFTVIIAGLLFLMFISAPKKGDVIVVDCRLAEISPDFTNQMRQACREVQAKDIQKNLQKPK